MRGDRRAAGLTLFRRASVLILAAMLLAGCGEEFAIGSIWASNQSDQDVIIRSTRLDYSDKSLAIRRAWRVPAGSLGVVVNENSGVVEALDPTTCVVLASGPVTAFAVGIEIARDVSITISDKAGPVALETDYEPKFARVTDCLGASISPTPSN